MRSYYKRLEQFKSYQIKTDKLPLSAYLFMDYGPEIVSFYGGNDEAYLNFGGAVLLHWEMLKYAKSKSKSILTFTVLLKLRQLVLEKETLILSVSLADN